MTEGSLIDGVVVIDKHAGVTSHDIVQMVKRLYGARKAGHTGTLDPLATGVLPVCLNRATKLSEKLMMGDKEYEVCILFGVTTETLDLEGEVTKHSEVPANLLGLLKNIIPDFMGNIKQVPPYYSAVKYKGRPLYKWARSGKFIDLPPRSIEVRKFDLLGVEGNCVTARVVCSKGTYIRSLCHDLGCRVGSGACMKSLRRTATGRFYINNAVKVDEIEACHDITARKRYVIDIDRLMETQN